MENIQDYDGILAVYNAIVDGEETNWWADDIFLLADGSDGLSGLKSRILNEETEQVYFGFYREETKVRPGFVVVNYIPPSVSGVRRARALVHSRRIASGFTREEHASLTVDHLSNLTPTAVHQAVLNPESTHFIQMERGTPSPTPSDITNSQIATRRTPKAIRLEPVRRSFSETYAPDKIPPHMQKTGSLFSSLLRRKGGRKDAISEEGEPLPPPPPPPPPKDMSGRQRPQAVTMGNSLSLSEFAMISHDSDGSSSDEQVIVEHPSPPRFSPPVLDGKWNANATTTIIADPAERARRRQVAREQKELEDQQALEEEAQRQYLNRLQKEEMMRQEEEEEQNRRASLERELKRSTEARRRKQQEEREEEERKRREIEQRKRETRARRLEEHKRLEEWRIEQARMAQEAVRREEAMKRREANERKNKIAQVEAKVKSNSKSQDLITGWVTLQTTEHIVWRRRYYRFIGNTLFLYRSPKDIHQVTALKEWNEGYEDLKAIPHSFAIEFNDRDPWAMFCDQEEEKIKLLGLLHYTAGL
ncbi:hypothetical protein BDZ89DRAFT_1089099 [Hymenopellis radicata]|nr:hypothetical protein BDZ89DRAFT_1089099 [Hymenopellis radicata]